MKTADPYTNKNFTKAICLLKTERAKKLLYNLYISNPDLDISCNAEYDAIWISLENKYITITIEDQEYEDIYE